MTTAELTSDPSLANALDTFVRRARAHYPVDEAYLFGSRARSDHDIDSDADVALILDETAERQALPLKRDLSDLAFDLLLETGVYIQHVVIPKEHWRFPDRFGNPNLLQAIRCDGRRL
ncbi:MAG: nucleotidyltransferase domain-containing protein [Rhodovibrio sp.]|nr:nucleotidyltransferase domain-containing protein [Rhodovibrio sp.]